MSNGIIKPKPGVYKGIKYRSQLEIAWAKYFDGVDIAFRYVDRCFCDFAVPGWDFCAFEVKPAVPSLVCKAIRRWFTECGYQAGTMAVIMVGPPPSEYGYPVLILAILTCDEMVMLCCSDFEQFVHGPQPHPVRARLSGRHWMQCRDDDELHENTHYLVAPESFFAIDKQG